MGKSLSFLLIIYCLFNAYKAIMPNSIYADSSMRFVFGFLVTVAVWSESWSADAMEY